MLSLCKRQKSTDLLSIALSLSHLLQTFLWSPRTNQSSNFSHSWPAAPVESATVLRWWLQVSMAPSCRNSWIAFPCPRYWSSVAAPPFWRTDLSSCRSAYHHLPLSHLRHVTLFGLEFYFSWPVFPDLSWSHLTLCWLAKIFRQNEQSFFTWALVTRDFHKLQQLLVYTGWERPLELRWITLQPPPC